MALTLSRQNSPLGHIAERYEYHYVFFRESGIPSAENEDIGFNLKGHSGSVIKHNVRNTRDTGCVVEMDVTEKDHDVEMEATKTEHEVETDATEKKYKVEMEATEIEHKVEMDATETDHEVEIEKTEAVAAGWSLLYTLLVMI